MVQVASVRNLRNARILTAQLRKMGFDAKTHPGRHDPYLHVQIGPFANIDQAQAMRRRVAARGYTAAVK
jgi:cell division septation protein DedD